MALTEYNGQIQFAAAQDWLSVPFTFRAVSNATGTLTVTAFDEHFFYTAEAPKLSGATVRVVDSISREEVAVLTTDANGAATATALREGYYDMEVRADKHDTYRATIFLSSGITNTVRAYLPTQAITYTWTVVPIEIEERYEITISTVFETNVPSPIVTLYPSTIDLAPLKAVGDKMQVDVTLKNDGLVKAVDTDSTSIVIRCTSSPHLLSTLATLRRRVR